MSSSEEDDFVDMRLWIDLDPRIFKRIINMPFYTSLGDIRLLEHMKKRKLTKDEKDAAELQKIKTSEEEAETLYKFIEKISKLGDEYEYKNKKYSDQINETVKLLHHWSDTGFDRVDEHRRVGDLLGEKIRLEEAKKRLAYSKALHERLGSRSLAPDDAEVLRKILASKKNIQEKPKKKPKKPKKKKAKKSKKKSKKSRVR